MLSRESARDYLYREEVEFLEPRFPCANPVELPSIGLPSMFDPAQREPLTLVMKARCRKCDGCLAHRRALWTARAMDELKSAHRTWFGTLTIRPSERVRLRYLAESRYLRAGREALSSLDDAEQFRIVCRQLGRELTLFLKRVREQCGPFRYLVVVERHKSGDPHLHILLHEASAALLKAKLEAQWRIGFSHWRLVDGADPRSAYYVCKYLAKDALTRVRASQRYGQGGNVALVTERMRNFLDAVSKAPRSQLDGSVPATTADPPPSQGIGETKG